MWAVRTTPLDAIPDLSDTQVIIRTTLPGQAPQIVEDQVTYPLTTTMLSVPGAKAVRGYSFFGDSFVYVLFEDGTDLYWARSRVLEYLNQVQGAPAAARRSRRSGPMRRASAGSTSTRWSIAPAGTTSRSCARCRTGSCKYELKTVPNVAEVATVGGMVRQYQVVVDPDAAARPTTCRSRKVIDGDPRRQSRGRRLGGRAGRGRVHGARAAAT